MTPAKGLPLTVKLTRRPLRSFGFLCKWLLRLALLSVGEFPRFACLKRSGTLLLHNPGRDQL